MVEGNNRRTARGAKKSDLSAAYQSRNNSRSQKTRGDAHLGENRREGHPQRQREVLHAVTGDLAAAAAVAFAALSSPNGQRSPAPPQVNPLVRPGAPGGRAGRRRRGGGPVGLRRIAGDVGGPVHRKGARSSGQGGVGLSRLPPLFFLCACGWAPRVRVPVGASLLTGGRGK